MRNGFGFKLSPDRVSGMKEFKAKYARAKPYLINRFL